MDLGSQVVWWAWLCGCVNGAEEDQSILLMLRMTTLWFFIYSLLLCRNWSFCFWLSAPSVYFIAVISGWSCVCMGVACVSRWGNSVSQRCHYLSPHCRFRVSFVAIKVYMKWKQKHTPIWGFLKRIHPLGNSTPTWNPHKILLLLNLYIYIFFR